MGFYEEQADDTIFSAVYKTETDTFYEYLQEQDKREIPERKEAARERFFFQIGMIVVATIIISFFEALRQPLFYIAVAVVAIGIGLIFLQNGVWNKGYGKYIEGLHQTALKKGKNVTLHVRLEIYKGEIYVDNGPERYYVRPLDVEEWYETENLLVIKIRQLKSIPCRELEKILVPKEVLGDKKETVEETLSQMIILGDKVLAKKKDKKRG